MLLSRKQTNIHSAYLMNQEFRRGKSYFDTPRYRPTYVWVKFWRKLAAAAAKVQTSAKRQTVTNKICSLLLKLKLN